MPKDPNKLDPKDRKAFLGCIKARNDKWSKAHGGKRPPAAVRKRHYSECAKSTGVENK